MEVFMNVIRKGFSNIALTLLILPVKLHDQQRMNNSKGPKKPTYKIWFRFMVFNATFNNISVISWRSVLLVEKTVVPGENHQPVASHWQTLSHNVVSSTPRLIGIDCTGSCNTNYHLITSTTAPPKYKETQKLNSVILFKNNINIGIQWIVNFF